MRQVKFGSSVAGLPHPLVNSLASPVQGIHPFARGAGDRRCDERGVQRWNRVIHRQAGQSSAWPLGLAGVHDRPFLDTPDAADLPSQLD